MSEKLEQETPELEKQNESPKTDLPQPKVNIKDIIKDASNKIIKNSENLESMIKKIFTKKFRLVN